MASVWHKVWGVVWRRNIPGAGGRGQALDRGGKEVNQTCFTSKGMEGEA